MSSVTFRGLAGESAFRVPFVADSIADLTVTVGGASAPSTFSNGVVTITTPLVADADVVISQDASNIVEGSLSATGDSSATPFVANRHKPITLHLTGTWVGTVTVKRKLPGESAYAALTVNSTAWGVYTTNVNEQVWEESEYLASFIVDFSRTSGTVSYRFSQ